MSAGSLRWMPLSGRSMWPLSPPLEVAIGWRGAPLQRGDCVAFVGDNGLGVLHRVVAIDGDRVWTRGDTVAVPDRPWPRSAAIGKVVAVRWRGFILPVPQEGSVSNALRHTGVAWSHLAPHLRLALRRLRGRPNSAAKPLDC